MPKERPSNHQLQRVINTYAAHGCAKGAKLLGMPPSSFSTQCRMAEAAGIKPSASVAKQLSPEKRIRQLESELAEARKESADAFAIKEIIRHAVDMADKQEIPSWISAPLKTAGAPGVPTLFWSDFHWGENVRPGQIGGVNEYNLKIAHERLHTSLDVAIHLLRILDPKMRYPGIVIPLGGDMVSGDIHEELAESNELPTIPTVLDMEVQLAAAINRAADEFGSVFLPCVTGNHGRNTKKIRAKDRHHTSFDWLLYQLLARRFVDDKRVTFHIPDGSDAYYRIYNTRYALTHGDQFRGGDGMIGALGPIIRGDHKKRSRNSQIDMEYDILLMGHWHQYMQLTRLVVNGSLKGYDEYAWSNNFGFERAQQALWVTHPKYGPTYRCPVYVDRTRAPLKTDWVSIPKAAA